MLLDGSVQIISLYRTDSGIYICVADNGIGQPVQREVKLEVIGISFISFLLNFNLIIISYFT